MPLSSMVQGSHKDFYEKAHFEFEVVNIDFITYYKECFLCSESAQYVFKMVTTYLYVYSFCRSVIYVQ